MHRKNRLKYEDKKNTRTRKKHDITNKLILTIPQASDLMNISRNEFERTYILTGKVGIYERGSRKFIPRTDLEKELIENTRYNSKESRKLKMMRAQEVLIDEIERDRKAV